MNFASLSNTSLSVNPKGINYQELYEQTKKNTAIFIKLVDAELSKILNQHKKQRAWLEKENYLLREEIKSLKSQQTACQPQRRKQAPRSLNKYNFEQNSRDISSCSISKISFKQSTTVPSERKRSVLQNYGFEEKGGDENEMKDKSILSISKTMKLFSDPQQKDSSTMLTIYETQDPNKENDVSSHRKSIKKAPNVLKLNDKDRVTDVLKNIRQKALTPRNSNRQQPQYLQTNIICPSMFGCTKKNN